ncbi:MAG: hypothetical protein IJL43_00500 [Lachnospiraceae bacterium]|nr:hypothetical protein [Lachnospiraceae bacterium]
MNKYDVGDVITFYGTVSRKETTASGKDYYYVKEWPGIPFEENTIKLRNRKANVTLEEKELLKQMVVSTICAIFGAACAIIFYTLFL